MFCARAKLNVQRKLCGNLNTDLTRQQHGKRLSRSIEFDQCEMNNERNSTKRCVIENKPIQSASSWNRFATPTHQSPQSMIHGEMKECYSWLTDKIKQ